MTKSNDNLADRTTLASIKLIRWLRAADPTPELTGAQASTLGVIIFSGGISPSELAEIEEVKRPTVARTISQLEAKNLIIRETNEGDGRGATIKSTSIGRELFTRGHQRRIKPLNERLEKLTLNECQALSDGIEILESILNGQINK